MSNALPNVEEAQATLYAQVYDSVFFQKMANAGYPPRTETEAQAQLQTAETLRQAIAEDQIKSASAENSPYVRILEDLTGTTQQYYGFAAKQANDVYESSVRNIAENLMQDPKIYNAVLSLKANEITG